MLGNFSYCNPTKLYFGENSLSNLSDELRKYGDNVVLVYGTGSIKKNGIYDDIIKILRPPLQVKKIILAPKIFIRYTQ